MTFGNYTGLSFTQKNPDFNSLWLCEGQIGSLGLTIVRLEELKQHRIASAVDNRQLTAIGMSCPFSLPEKFISFWSEKRHQQLPNSWIELVERVLSTSYEMFLVLAKEYAELTNRLTDERFKKFLPGPLYHASPNLLRSCFQGLRLLASFDPSRHKVLPFFNSASPETTSIVETSPRATLHALGFPTQPYRSSAKREPAQFQYLRAEIVRALLEFREHATNTALLPRIVIPKHFVQIASDSPDALDSIISVYTSCLLFVRPQLFDDPFESNDSRVLLEGWLYAPCKYAQHTLSRR